MIMTRRAMKLALLGASLMATTPVLAQQVSYPVEEVAVGAKVLKAGDYVWQPELASEGDVTVVVSLADQIAHVYRGGTLIGVTTVSSGKAGYDTPVGRFTILQKAVDHVSNLYDAEMPYMQRLTWDGIALHSGHVTGKPASHGCVRLPDGFAKLLFGATQMGGQVIITDGPAMAPYEDAGVGVTTVATQPRTAPAPLPSAPQPETITAMQTSAVAGS